ncbi:dihydrofolate reductase family protein [Brachybacterium sp. DNPG3]
MHLLLRDGAPLPAPLPLADDAAGAETIADLYAFAPDRTTVRAMMNTTVDGAIVGPDGTSGPLRNPDDSLVFSVLRSLCDVVLIGASTFRAEDYARPNGREDLLSPSRRPGGADRPVLAIMTRSGDLPALDPAWPTLLLCPSDRVEAVARRTGLASAQVLGADGPAAAIAALERRGLRAIQAEGGPRMLGGLASDGVLDELCFSTTHRTVGGAPGDSASRVIDGPAHDLRWELASLVVGTHATMARYRRER